MRIAVLRVGGVRFRGVLGSLVVVPIVILLWGTTWSFGDRSIDHRWLVPGIWGVWGVLAVARIAAPGFSAARRALAGADADLAPRIRERLILYQAGRAYVDHGRR